MTAYSEQKLGDPMLAPNVFGYDEVDEMPAEKAKTQAFLEDTEIDDALRDWAEDWLSDQELLDRLKYIRSKA